MEELLLGTEGENLAHVLGAASRRYADACERAMMPGSTPETKEREAEKGDVGRGAFGALLVDRQCPCRPRRPRRPRLGDCMGRM